MEKLIYSKTEKKLILGDESYSLSLLLEGYDIESIAFNYIKGIETQLVEGLNLEDFYLYDNITLYYFERNNIMLKLMQIFTCLIILKQVLEKFTGDFIIETDNEIMRQVALRVFNIQYKNIQIIHFQSKSNLKWNDRLTLLRIINTRILSGIIRYLKFKLSSKGKEKFLMLTHSADINYVKYNGGYRFYNTQLGPVIDYLEKKTNLLNIQFTSDLLGEKKLLSYNKDYVPFEFFILYKKIISKSLINPLKIKDNIDFINKLDFSYENYDLKSVVVDNALNNLRDRYKTDLIEVLAAERLIKKLKIHKCLVMNEGDRNRSFIIAGYLQNINTYAVQHGIINETSTAYIINSKYVYNLVPTKSFLWGNKFQKLLIENSDLYNKSNTQVVGQIRTDLLKERESLNNSDKGKKIKILYATQYLEDLLRPATIILLKSLKMFNDSYELIIKLHPADNNYDFYVEALKNYNIKTYKIVRDNDLYDLIDWSDVIVSVHSTVVVEGALMNKPSICILLPKYNDAGGFVRDGISMGARNEQEFVNCLNSVKENRDFRFNSYIHENFYKIDGKVTERIINEISL